MDRIMIFMILSVPIIVVSWRTMFNLQSHGFYRFFSWECIGWLFATNYKYWFDNPFSCNQIFSWIFLFISGYLIIIGIIVMKKVGNPKNERNEKTLYQFEKTTELVDKGIYKYIRHPLYSSLLFLTWGIFLKHFTFELFYISIISTIFLYLTAKFDEKECINFFGDKYIAYMKRSKRFIPFMI
jgi:protein-S-isoprenylcysteine O-methyltransferase Ste14